MYRVEYIHRGVWTRFSGEEHTGPWTPNHPFPKLENAIECAEMMCERYPRSQIGVLDGNKEVQWLGPDPNRHVPGVWTPIGTNEVAIPGRAGKTVFNGVGWYET